MVSSLVELGQVIAVSAPAVALLLYRKRTDQTEDTLHQYRTMFQTSREARLQLDGPSILEALSKVKIEHRLNGSPGIWRNLLDTRANHFFYSRVPSAPSTLDSELADTFGLDDRGNELDTTRNTDLNTGSNTLQNNDKDSGSLGSEVSQTRTNETMIERKPIPPRTSSLDHNGSNLDHGHTLAAVQEPHSPVATPPRHRSNSLVKKSSNRELREVYSLSRPSTTPEGLPRAMPKEMVKDMSLKDMIVAGTVLNLQRQNTDIDGGHSQGTRPVSIQDPSDHGLNDPEVPAGPVNAAKVNPGSNIKLGTGKNLIVAEEIGAAERKGGDNASTFSNQQVLLRAKGFELPGQILFKDSGYGTPHKSEGGKLIVIKVTNENDELDLVGTPAESGSEDKEGEISLMRMPSETREPPDLSLNKVDNLATKFANLAIRYHDLGHEYLVEQSNEELDAQRNNKAQTQTDKLSVKISNIITRVCLCDPEVTGTPIVMCSRDFQLPIAAVENDDGMLLNLPEDHNGCALRIERGENGRKVYYLDISMPLIDNNDGVNKFAILSHIDITSAVDQLAVQEYRAQRASFKSAVSFDLEGDDWIEQAVIESDKEQALIRYEETYLGPPSPHMRRLLAFIQTLKREHLECCVFAGKKDIGWELINWKVHHISEQLYEPGKRPIYEKGMDEYIWESIAHHMDESEDGFQWPQKISWGRTKELRLGYFVPMTDGHHIDDERREKWWLMVLSDFDEDIWRTERIV